MASKPLSVLRVNSVEETANCRRAVSTVIGNILRDNGLTLVDLAETIDVSLGTISNAFNRKSDLSATYQHRLALAFGPEVLNPVAALTGGQIVPMAGGKSADILPLVSRVALHIAEARSPESEGGIVETHREQLGNLPYLRNLYRELGALIAATEELAA